MRRAYTHNSPTGCSNIPRLFLLLVQNIMDADAVVDVCFVGAGIACMYAAHELLRRRPDARVLLLERARRAGGRAWGSTFAGVTVSHGAGVVRTAHVEGRIAGGRTRGVGCAEVAHRAHELHC
jgi:ribulose 1,5-bisphosphate synthetase/thiazole synthase